MEEEEYIPFNQFTILHEKKKKISSLALSRLSFWRINSTDILKTQKTRM